jgi:hypothetical protein
MITTDEFETPTATFRKYGTLLLIVDLDPRLDMSHVYARGYHLKFLDWGVYSVFLASFDTS